MNLTVWSRMSSSIVSILYLMPAIGCGGSGPSSTIFCLPIFAPARLHCRIVYVGRKRVQQIARADRILQRGRIGVPEWVLHRD